MITYTRICVGMHVLHGHVYVHVPRVYVYVHVPCMHACMLAVASMYVCMYVNKHTYMHACFYVEMQKLLHVCMYVW